MIVELPDICQVQIKGNVVIRPITFASRHQVLPGHRHNFDHVTMVAVGTVRFSMSFPDGTTKEETHTAPAWVEVPKEATHQIESMTDHAQCYCVFACRDEDGAVAEFVTEQHRRDSFPHFREGQG
jgi:cupin superfamily acireductone dioxygenase involved in methionine salvage